MWTGVYAPDLNTQMQMFKTTLLVKQIKQKEFVALISKEFRKLMSLYLMCFHLTHLTHVHEIK